MRTPTRSVRALRDLTLSLALTASACIAARAAEGEGAVHRLYTASDLPRLARGVGVPRAGTYHLKVWAPARQRWAVDQAAPGDTEGSSSPVVLTAKVEGKDEKPAWQDLGPVELTREKPRAIRVMGLELESKSAQAGSGARKKAGPAAKEGAKGPVPALILLSSDPEADPAPLLDLARGQVGRVAAPVDSRRTTVRTNQEGADFRAPASAQAWRDRARAVRAQMLVALGLWPMPPKTELNPQVFGKLERDGYTIEKVVLETLPGFTLSGNLYRPAGKAGKVPGVLCPHGHWPDGRMNPELQMRCIRWAKLGCVVFLYDMVGYNDSKPFPHSFLDDRLRRWGLSLAALQTWNSIRALDWLTSLPDVDAARIGCTGESGGGTQTFLLTAIDDRVKVAAPVVMVSDSFQGGCVCENAAGLRLGTDNVEIAALAAPRPMKLVGATGDWTAKTMFRAYPQIREVYAIVGAPERLGADVFDFPHNYNQTTRNAVYAFMARWLLGIDDPERTREGDQSPERPEDLRTFDDEHPAPAGRKTPEQLEAELVNLLGRQLDKLAPGTHAAPWQAARDLLRTALEVRVGLTDPAPAELGSQEVRRVSRDELTIVHYLVGRRSGGERIPVVRLIPKEATGRLTVLLSESGKAGLAMPHGQGGEGGSLGRPNRLVQALLDRGQSVVGFDPLLIGESVDPGAFATRRPDTVHYETYNRSLAADRAQDLATVLAWSRAQPDVLEVSLLGQGRIGPLALLARPALEGLARTAVDLHDFDYGDGSGSVPEGLDLPGVLQFGGLKAAAALTAPAPLWIYRAGEAFDTSWPVNAYTLADAETMLRVDRQRPGVEELSRWLDTAERTERR